MPRPATFEDLKPFLWLVLAAFMAGFVSYLVLGEGSHAAAQEKAPYVAAASAPASDAWNLPKRI